MTRLVVLLAALLAAAAAVQGSQATFTASKTNAGSSFVTASKFPPTVTLTAPADGSATNDTTPTLSGAADNVDRRLRRRHRQDLQRLDRHRHAPCRRTTATRTGTTLDAPLTTALAPGTYTAQATQTDTSGNTGTSNANTFTVDTTKPTADLASSATNKTGGTAGKIENGDTAHLHLLRADHRGLGVERLERREHGRERAGSPTRQRRHRSRSSRRPRAPIKLGSVATNGNYVSADHDLRLDDGALGRRRLDRRHARHARQRAGHRRSPRRT